MTKELAIQILRGEVLGTSEQTHEAVFMAIRAIKNDFKWIPVSERLPERDEDVLLCFKEGPNCPYYQIQVGSLGTHEVEDNNFEIIGYADVWYTDDWYTSFEDVAAWMPLPEPYKNEESKN